MAQILRQTPAPFETARSAWLKGCALRIDVAPKRALEHVLEQLPP